MKDLSTVSLHPVADKLVKVLNKKTQSSNDLFFHILVAYYFAKVASMMRVTIETHDRGSVPVNLYAINLATSGAGKGYSTNIIEEHVIHIFRDKFLEETFPIISNKNLANIAVKRANKKASDPDEELERVHKEFENLGQLAFSFDSGTTAALKQMRHKLLMANAGSMNMEIDEIGSNLLGMIDILPTLLELFDVGKVKQKLTKNTAENVRSEEIDGRTPTNVMMFGTPSKLLNGDKTEEAFISFLETGGGRRCLFGYSKSPDKMAELTPLEVYNMTTDKSSVVYLNDLAHKLGKLADISNFNKPLQITKDVTLLLIEYKIQCEKISAALPEHLDIRKAEISHRYFKTLKLAGTYAFIDGSPTVTETHLYNAIKLVELSGEAFSSLMNRERNYVKLAKYIAAIEREVTHVDLVEDLAFYKGSEAAKRELMTLAIVYGYKNNIIIKKVYTDGIEFFSGETLKETDVDKMQVSYSTQLGANYKSEYVPFDKLHQLTQQSNYHWANHHFIDNHRNEENAIAGFNMVVIDVDDGVDIKTVELLLKEYKTLIYTTKRHTDKVNRFRIILPLTHTLKMDSVEFKEFMNNIYEWLPFDSDTTTNTRSKKWLSHPGKHFYNDGKLLDALLFIPKTSKNEERKQVINDQQSLSNMERWFTNNTGTGNRSNMLIRYALLLVESGMDLTSVQNNILALNSKLPDKMDEAEIMSTILVTASKAIHRRDIQ